MGTGLICRNGPVGASHKLAPSPFSLQEACKAALAFVAAALRDAGLVIVASALRDAGLSAAERRTYTLRKVLRIAQAFGSRPAMH
jgi:hypothetical protein